MNKYFHTSGLRDPRPPLVVAGRCVRDCDWAPGARLLEDGAMGMEKATSLARPAPLAAAGAQWHLVRGKVAGGRNGSGAFPALYPAIRSSSASCAMSY